MSNSNSAASKTTWVGLDVHRDSITSAVLAPDRETPVVDRWFHDEPSVRRFVSGLGPPARVRLCYEAGPTGYDLARLLGGSGGHRSHRSLADPGRTGRQDQDRRPRRPAPRPPLSGRRADRGAHPDAWGRGDPRPGAHTGRTWSSTAHAAGTGCPSSCSAMVRSIEAVWHWTLAHEAWLRHVHFEDAALMSTYSHYRAIVAGLDAHLAAVESDLKSYLERGPFAEAVSRLSAYRGVTELGALTLSAEVCDWRRFPRATSLMGFCGLVPTEYSSGERNSAGRITKAGNIHLRTQLVEAAWSYQHRPAVGATIKKRQERAGHDTVTRAWAAQLHLCAKFRRLAERKSSRNVVVTAIARELAGSSGPRWRREVTRTTSSPTPRRGDEREFHHAPGHRRGREDPRSSYATRSAPGSASSEGHHPAHRRPAVRTRVHQSGGPPTHLVPAHGRVLIRPPPTSRGAEA